MIGNFIAWLIALIAMNFCQFQDEQTCAPPPPPSASPAPTGSGAGVYTNPKIINEI